MSRYTECQCYTCGHVWEARVIAGHKASPWDRWAEPDEYEPADCPRCQHPEEFEAEEAADEFWARGMIREQLRDLYKAMLTCQSRADGALEFAEEIKGPVQLDHDTRAEIARTVDRLQRLYFGSEAR